MDPAPRPHLASPPGPRALLVDDSEVALRYLDRQLHRQGLQTECVTSSQQALHCLGREAYDVVFIDVELGAGSELDGLQLCQQLHRRAAKGRRPRLVLVSAHQAPLDRVRGTLAGCDAYLGKPLKLPDLVQVLGPVAARA